MGIALGVVCTSVIFDRLFDFSDQVAGQNMFDPWVKDGQRYGQTKKCHFQQSSSNIMELVEHCVDTQPPNCLRPTEKTKQQTQ